MQKWMHRSLLVGVVEIKSLAAALVFVVATVIKRSNLGYNIVIRCDLGTLQNVML